MPTPGIDWSAVYAANAAVVWVAVRQDLTNAATGQPDGALWGNNAVPADIAAAWSAACIAFDNNTFGTDWTFWITFYERVLAGKNIHADMLVPILNGITEEDWLGDPDPVNAQFADVLAVYRGEDAKELADKTPYGEVVSYDTDANAYVLSRDDQIQPDFLVEVIDQIKSGIRVFGQSDSLSNQYSALGEVVSRLENIVAHDADKPVQIFKNTSYVQKRLSRLIAKKECPSAEEDDNIDELQSILAGVSFDLLKLSDKVKAYNEATGKRVSVSEHQLLADGIQTALPAVDPTFKAELEKDRQILLDPDASEADKAEAAYATGSRFSRAYRAGRKVLKEAA